jgi:large subunit ribosomal protein L6
VSRIGRLPIEIPADVQVDIQGSHVQVKGPKGSLENTFSPEITIAMENGQITVTRPNDEARMRALHGTTRAVLNNMVSGVSSGFKRVLEIDGVGYRPDMDGDKLVLYVGFSHPVVIDPPAGITFEVDAKARQITVLGYDKEAIGQLAANIRKVRPPEPYKGKGIHYLGERIRRKAGKAGKAK